MMGNVVELCPYLALDICDPRFEWHYLGNAAKWCCWLVHSILHAYYGIWSVTWLKNVIIIFVLPVMQLVLSYVIHVIPRK